MGWAVKDKLAKTTNTESKGRACILTGMSGHLQHEVRLHLINPPQLKKSSPETQSSTRSPKLNKNSHPCCLKTTEFLGVRYPCLFASVRGRTEQRETALLCCRTTTTTDPPPNSLVNRPGAGLKSSDCGGRGIYQ